MSQPFRIVVGAQTSASSQQLKDDIKNILADLPKESRQITLTLNSDATKQAIQADLNNIAKDLTLNFSGVKLTGTDAITKQMEQIAKTSINVKSPDASVANAYQAMGNAAMVAATKIQTLHTAEVDASGKLTLPTSDLQQFQDAANVAANIVVRSGQRMENALKLEVPVDTLSADAYKAIGEEASDAATKVETLRTAQQGLDGSLQLPTTDWQRFQNAADVAANVVVRSGQRMENALKLEVPPDTLPTGYYQAIGEAAAEAATQVEALHTAQQGLSGELSMPTTGFEKYKASAVEAGQVTVQVSNEIRSEWDATKNLMSALSGELADPFNELRDLKVKISNTELSLVKEKDVNVVENLKERLVSLREEYAKLLAQIAQSALNAGGGVAGTSQTDMQNQLDAMASGYGKVQAAAEKQEDAIGRATTAYAKQRQEVEQLASVINQKQLAGLSTDSTKIIKDTTAYKELETAVKNYQQTSAELTNQQYTSENATQLAQALKQQASAYSEVAAKQAAYNQVVKTFKQADSIRDLLSKSTQDVGVFKDRLDDLMARFKSGKIDIDQLDSELKTLRSDMSAAGITAQSTGERFVKMFTAKVGYAVIAAALMKIRQAMRELYTNVVELDSALTQLEIVTGTTGAALDQFASKAADAAQATGKAVTDILSSVETYARLGYSLEDALDLSTVTAQLSNVADVEQSEATTMMTSILKGFGKEASDAENVADILTLVGKKYAISASELGTGLENGGAAMAAANNTLEESVALLAAGNAAVQDASTVGNAFKTTTLRIRGATAELEQSGETVDEFCESTSKMRDTIKALSGVDIMASETEFKSTYQIILEIAKVWDKMTDINQASLLEALGGKRNASVLASAIENVDDLKGAYEDASNAAGTLAESNAVYMESIEAKVSQLSAAWQELSANLLDSSIVTGPVDILRGLLTLLNNLDEASGGLTSVFLDLVAAVTIVGGVIGAFQSRVGILGATLGNVGSGLAAVAKALFGIQTAEEGAAAAAGTEATAETAAATAETAHGVSAGVAAELEGQLTIEETASAAAAGAEATAETAAATAETAHAGVLALLKTRLSAAASAMGEFAAAHPLLLVVAVTGAAYALATAIYNKLNPSLDELRQETSEAESQCTSLQSEIETTTARIKELQKQADDTGLTLVEEDELQRLQQTNSLLESELAYYQQIAAMKKETEQQEALDEYNEFITPDFLYTDAEGNPIGTSDLDNLQDRIDDAKKMAVELQQAYENNDTAAIQKLTDKISSNAGYIENEMSKLKNVVDSFDYTSGDDLTPKQASMNEAINLYGRMLDQVNLLSDSATRAETVMNRVFNSDEFEAGAEALEDLAESGEMTDNSLRELIANNDDVKTLVRYLQELGLIKVGDLSGLVSYLQQTDEAASSAGIQLKSLSSIIDSLSGAFDVMATAVKESNNNGYVSLDTLSKMSSKYPELLKYLEQTSKGYKVTNKSMQEYTAACRSSYTTDLNNAKAAAMAVVTGQNNEAEAYKLTTAAIKEQLQAKITKYKSDLAIAQKQQMLSYGDDMYDRQIAAADKSSAVQIAEGQLSALRNALSDLENAQTNLDNFNSVATTMTSDSSKTSSSSSSTDKYKQNVEDQIKILKHKYDMDLLTEKEYYAELKKIKEQYYEDTAEHRKKYEEEIWDLEQQIFNGERDIFDDWMNDQDKILESMADARNLSGQEQLYQELLKAIEAKIADAKEYGLDENSDYIQELRSSWKKYQEDWLDLVTDTYDEYISYMDDFDLWKTSSKSRVEVLQQEQAEIKNMYQQGLISWKNYVSEYNEIGKDLYSTQKDAIETIIDLTMDMIKQEAEDEVEALEQQVTTYEKIISAKKKLLEQSKTESDYEDEVAEKVKAISKLQSQISQLSLDDSRSAAAQKAALEEELAEKQKELADYQKQYVYDTTTDTLDDELDEYKETKEAEEKLIEKSVDTWVKLYNKAIDRINAGWDDLYDALYAYQSKYRSSIDGMDSLVTAWDNASEAVKRYNGNVEEAYKNLSADTIDPTATSSSEAQAILAQMEANSIKAKQNGTRIDPDTGKDLNEANTALAKQYEALTGRAMQYDTSRGWYWVDSGDLVYDVSSVKKTTSGTTSSAASTTSTKVSDAASKLYTAPSSSDTIQMNSTGDKVKWVQYVLQKTTDSSLPITGQFWTSTQAAVKAFQKANGLTQDGIVGPKTIAALKKYHTGGVVDSTGSIGDNEVLAILKRGELVLNDAQKANLKDILGNLKDTLSTLVSANLSTRMESIRQSVPAVAGGDTYSPVVNVTIQHSGTMTDSDADKYGKKIANTALDTLYTTLRTRGIKK